MSSFKHPDGLAALGAMQFQSYSQEGKGELSHEAAFYGLPSFSDRGIMPCLISLDLVNSEGGGDTTEDKWVGLWQEALVVEQQKDPGSNGVTLGVELATPKGTAPLSMEESWKVVHHLKQGSGVASVFISDRGLRKTSDWHWPLRVGFLSTPGVDTFVGDTAGSYHTTDLLDICMLEPGDECDLLILRGMPGMEEQDQLKWVRASAILVMLSPEACVPNPEAWGPLKGAMPLSAVACLRCRDGFQEAFRRLIDEISHDKRFDQAIRAAAPESEDYLLIAHPEWLKQPVITTYMRRMDRAIRRARSLDGLPPRVLRAARPEMEELWTKARDKGFVSERGLAFELATAVRQMYSNLPEPGLVQGTSNIGRFPASGKDEGLELLETKPGAVRSARSAVSRMLLCQVLINTGTELRPVKNAFVGGQPHTIRLCIGPEKEGWWGSGETFPQLPAATRHDLEVVVIPLWGDAQTQRASLTLPESGVSPEVTFILDVPKATQSWKRLEVLVEVLYLGRHIQMAKLDGPVQNSGEDVETGAEQGISFHAGSWARVDFNHLQRADLTLTCTGETINLSCPERALGTLRLPDLRQWIENVRDLLADAQRAGVSDEGGWTEDGSIRQLRALAIQGAFLKRKLFRNTPEAESAARIEIISESSTESLPLELLYDFESPDDEAKLCEDFVASACPSCPEGCRFSDDPTRFCPLRFWGVGRIIGRQLSDVSGTTSRGSSVLESSTARQTLGPLDHVLMAASSKVDTVQQGVTKHTFDGIQVAVHGSARHADTWGAWTEDIAARYPSLLVLIPHNEPGLSLPSLEIGNLDRLRLDRIRRDHVRGSSRTSNPVILLLGCSTAAPNIGFEDYVIQFRESGAAVVVGTTTPVLGRQAAPMALALVQRICAPGRTGLSFGEVMRLMRLELLSEGHVMSLALVAFGDTDWKIA